MQPNCNREGFNIYSTIGRIRIGFAGNNENDCETPDSVVGVGGDGDCPLSLKTYSGNSGCAMEGAHVSVPADVSILVK